MEMNDVTFIILKTVLAICSALITGYLLPYLKTKFQNEKYTKVEKIITTAVKAVEQTLSDPGMGEKKKEVVFSYMYHWMTKNGIFVDEEQLNQLIEACVFQMNKEE